jgi:hypothetical protein
MLITRILVRGETGFSRSYRQSSFYEVSFARTGANIIGTSARYFAGSTAGVIAESRRVNIYQNKL